MDLSNSVVYSSPATNEIGLINPIRNDLDDQFFELATELGQLPLARRREIQASMASDTCWTLVVFAERAAVFALREEDPDKVQASFVMLAMAVNRNDPRDIIIAANRILYVADKLGVAVPDIVREHVAISDRHTQRMIGNQFEREPNENPTPRGFRELQTRFGTGLVDGDSAPYEPKCDLLEAVIDIVELVKADEFYSSVSVQIESGRPPAILPNRGAFWLVSRTNFDAHPDMRHQMFHMRLVEFPDEATLNQQLALIGRANPREVQFKVSNRNLLFTAVARSFVEGVENVETNESIQRFVEPVQAILAAAVEQADR